MPRVTRGINHTIQKTPSQKLAHTAAKKAKSEERSKKFIAILEKKQILIEGRACFLAHLGDIGNNCDSDNVRNVVIPPLMIFLRKFRGFTAEYLMVEIEHVASSFEDTLQKKVIDIIIDRLELKNDV